MIFKREIPDEDVLYFIGMLAEELGGYPHIIVDTLSRAEIANPEDIITWVDRKIDESWKRKTMEYRKALLIQEYEAKLAVPEIQINRGEGK